MIPNGLVWLIFLLPIIAFLINSLLIRPFFQRYYRVAGYVTIGAIAGSLPLGLWLLRSVMGSPDHKIDLEPVTWLVMGDLEISIGLLLDSLTAVMVVVVALVSLMVQVYSQGYMAVKKDDHEFSPRGYIRYFAFMALFTGSMLGLVMARSLLFLYLFWEGVGGGSYFLIGFLVHRPPWRWRGPLAGRSSPGGPWVSSRGQWGNRPSSPSMSGSPMPWRAPPRS